VYELGLQDVASSHNDLAISVTAASDYAYIHSPTKDPVVLKYPNNDVDLTDLTVSVGAMSPSFTASTTWYQVVLPANTAPTSTITINATASSNVAKVYIGNVEGSSRIYTVSTLLTNGSVPVNVVSPTGVSKSYVIQFSKEAYTIVNAASPDLMIKFGIKTSGYSSHTAADVTATFNALHAYINDSTKFNYATLTSTSGNVVHLGDYIDLASLTVNTWLTAAGGGISITSNTDLGTHGKLLRIMVVGINSFNRRTSQPMGHINTPHVIFHFQNVTGTARMNATAINTTGYAGSEMRSYIVDRFMTGIKNAGVPEDVLWSPQRRTWAGSGTSDVQAITDTLWLPTEKEIFGHTETPADDGWLSNTGIEAGNQAYFEYYTTDAIRNKYNASNTKTWYWMASPTATNEAKFTRVYTPGSGSGAADALGGIAPAFCVK
jgi:hypothetical protein